ncbi:MAG: hypothetical protein KDA42_13070 [Planctomycetales bacterium]|nr:hypothetical protein [Planctomycetales bacterium]
MRIFIWLLVIATAHVDQTRAEELITNGQFANQREGRPSGWAIRTNKQEVSIDAAEAQHPEVKQALRIDIVCDGGSSYGQIAQSLAVEPNTLFRFTGDWRSSKGQSAFFEIKRLKNGKELERVHLGWSQSSWQRVVRQIDSGEADTLEVLCRYRQKKEFGGSVCWYTNVSLQTVDKSASQRDGVVTLTQPIAPPPRKAPTFYFPEENPDLRIASPGADQYVTPAGAGAKTGVDWRNARSAGSGGLQTAWDAVGPGNTLYLGSGEYKNVLLEIKAGGSGTGAMRRLQGVDTGNGLPLMAGSLDMENIHDGWQTMVVGSSNTGYWELNGLRFRNCSCAIRLYGGNVGVRLSHLDIAHVREGLTLDGMADPQGRFATRDITISDCRVNVYTKRGIRMRDGVREVRIERVAVNAGGKDWVREAFPIGFQVSSEWNMPECRDITNHLCRLHGGRQLESQRQRLLERRRILRRTPRASSQICPLSRLQQHRRRLGRQIGRSRVDRLRKPAQQTQFSLLEFPRPGIAEKLHRGLRRRLPQRFTWNWTLVSAG